MINIINDEAANSEETRNRNFLKLLANKLI